MDSKGIKSPCCSQSHETAVEMFPTMDSEFVVHIRKNQRRSQVSYKVVNSFFKQKLVPNKTERSHPVCSACVKYVETLLEGSSGHSTTSNYTSDSTHKRDHADSSDESSSGGHTSCDVNRRATHSFDEIKNQIKNFSLDQMIQIVKVIGDRLSHECNNFARKETNYDRMSKIRNSTYEDFWRSDCGPLLKQLLEVVVFKNETWRFSQEETQRKIRLMVKAVENIYSCFNPNYVSSLGLAENLVTHLYPGSKTVCNIMGKISACGSYWTVQKTLRDLSACKPRFPAGDIIVVYDNNQVIGKQYGVSFLGNLPSSTMTGITVVKPTTQLSIQSRIATSNILPRQFPPFLLQKYSKFSDEITNTHRLYRAQFIRERLGILKPSFARVQNAWIDNIDKEVHTNTEEKDVLNTLRYDRVPSGIGECSLSDQECLLLNPNSEESILKVLTHVQNQSRISDPDRKWFTLVQDGLPHRIAYSLIKRYKVCHICSKETADMDQHFLEKHGNHDATDNSDSKFKDIFLRAGNGHYEINIVRSIMSNFFTIYVEDIARMLGFKTPKSLEYCRSAADHHKSWQILQILFESLADELLTVFIKQQRSISDVTVEKYLLWCEKTGFENRNYSLAFDFVFGVLHPLFLFRAGIRQCNNMVSLMAREKAAAIFYAFNHPRYREINATDIFLLHQAPEEVKYVVQVESVVRPGGNVGEGLDFIQEYRNKMLKQIIPWEGVPTEAQWKRSSVLLQYMDEIKLKTLQQLQINPEPLGESRHMSFSREIFEARKIFRALNILGIAEAPFTTLTKKKSLINITFENFLHQAESNRKKYYTAMSEGKECKLLLCTAEEIEAPVDITAFRKSLKQKVLTLPSSLVAIYTKEMRSKMVLDDLIELSKAVDEELREVEAREYMATLSLGYPEN